jgi:hypothetical protein
MASGIEWYQYPFYMAGLTTPVSRFLATTMTVSSLILFFKPAFAFTPRGDARPWALLNGSNYNATPVAWWVPGVVFGGVFALFF